MTERDRNLELIKNCIKNYNINPDRKMNVMVNGVDIVLEKDNDKYIYTLSSYGQTINNQFLLENISNEMNEEEFMADIIYRYCV
jgi:hypothetical protein